MRLELERLKWASESRQPESEIVTAKEELLILWWARRDSNPQPRDYESPALTVELQALH
jgi:hypothetical protein